MSAVLHIVLLIHPLCYILACRDGALPKPDLSRLHPPTTNANVQQADSTAPQKFPLMSGTWKGIGKDQGRTFTWEESKRQLEGIYRANKGIKEDYSKVFRFRVEKGVLCCFPSSYNSDCATPEGTYRLIAQTDTSYTFEAERRPSNKTISTLEFSFGGQNRMKFQWNHDYADEDYPDYHIVRHFQRQ